MMKAYQIFQEMSSETAQGIFSFLREEHRDIYNSAMDTLAGQRRLRPIFMRKKPAPAQFAWLEKTTKLKQSDGVDEHLLQLWLLKKHQAMLIEFLDGIDIEHDGEGAVEDLPDEIDAKKLKSTVDGLIGKYSAEDVAVYLHTFQLQKIGGWDSLSDLIKDDPRLSFGAEEVAETPAKSAEPEAAEEVSEETES